MSLGFISKLIQIEGAKEISYILCKYLLIVEVTHNTIKVLYL